MKVYMFSHSLAKKNDKMIRIRIFLYAIDYILFMYVIKKKSDTFKRPIAILGNRRISTGIYLRVLGQKPPKKKPPNKSHPDKNP